MEIRHQGPYVPRSITARTQARQVLLVAVRKSIDVSLVYRIHISVIRHFHVRETQDERPDLRFQSETEDALSGGVHENRGGAVHDVSGSDLLPARLQHSRFSMRAFGTPQDGEDGSDADVYVDIRRTVQRVKHD